MIALVKFALSPIGRGLGAIAGILAVVLLIFNMGAAHGRKPAEADRDRWRATAATYLHSARAWEASYREDARLRGLEGAEAVSALNASSKACDARVATARKSSVAIQSIITREPAYDQAHCPIRRGVGVDRLRLATGLGPAG